jgi:hypothetical protein
MSPAIQNTDPSIKPTSERVIMHTPHNADATRQNERTVSSAEQHLKKKSDAQVGRM